MTAQKIDNLFFFKMKRVFIQLEELEWMNVIQLQAHTSTENILV